MIVKIASYEHYPWLEFKANVVLTRSAHVIEALDANGAIAGMMAFDHWTPNTATISLAIEKPIALRRLVKNAYDYVWKSLNKKTVLATALTTNKRSRRILEHFGFNIHSILKDGWSDGIDIITFSLTRNECRWC